MEPQPKRPRADFEGPGQRHPRAPGDGRDVAPEGKPKPCMKFFSTSGCPFGESCHFLHYLPGGLASVGRTPVFSLSAASASISQKKPPGSVGDPGVTVNGYKTKLCNRFNTQEGCRFGDWCHFVHGKSDLRAPNNTSRVNRRPAADGPKGTAPPGFINGDSQFPMPTSYILHQHLEVPRTMLLKAIHIRINLATLVPMTVLLLLLIQLPPSIRGSFVCLSDNCSPNIGF